MRSLLGLGAILMAGAVEAQTCTEIRHEDMSYVVCSVGIAEDLRIFHDAAGGGNLGSFGAVDAVLEAEGRRLAFGMNGGMYHPDRSPVGLLIEDGVELAPLVTAEGPGNFGLLPNGVFCIGADRFAVVESRSFAARPPACRYATQSGPMLVIGGRLHPRFIDGSDSRYVRNGVGVSRDGQTAWFAISAAPVNFARFARLFRDRFETPDALYFDGRISRLYAPDLGRDDFGFAMGPIVGLAVPTGRAPTLR